MKNIVFWDVAPPVHAVSSLAEFSTLKMEAIHSFETSIHIPEDGILHFIIFEFEFDMLTHNLLHFLSSWHQKWFVFYAHANSLVIFIVVV
jgi:hypothetical protein